MALMVILFNSYFDFLIAVLLGVLLGFIVALGAAKLRFIHPHAILNRLLLCTFLFGYALMLSVSLAIAKTDPDFSVVQRYKNAVKNIKSWVSLKEEDELLRPGGFEKALSLKTGWAPRSAKVFYTLDNALFAVNFNGENREEISRIDEPIRQAFFSPDGERIILKSSSMLTVVDIDKKEQLPVIDTTQALPEGAAIVIGGIQWSPDSKKLCYFVTKSSSVTSQTNWFVFDVITAKVQALPLKLQQEVFLTWGKDSQRLYYNRVQSVDKITKQNYKIAWYEVPLPSLIPVLVKTVIHDKIDVPDHILRKNNIFIAEAEKSLRFESGHQLVKNVFIDHEKGRRLFVNNRNQLCFQSGFGTRFRLFGLSTLGEYSMFPPVGQASTLTIQDIRWTPSGKYVLIKHYTHGLILMHPVSRKAGILADQVGIYGVFHG